MSVKLERGFETEMPATYYHLWPGQQPSECFDKRRLPYESISYGPLLFALAIPDKNANTPVPDARWQYALDNEAERNGSDITTQRKAMPARWSWQLDAPLALSVPATFFDWKPTRPHALPALPVKGGRVETIQLVPYGCTKFRISMFPVTEKAWRGAAAAIGANGPASGPTNPIPAAKAEPVKTQEELTVDLGSGVTMPFVLIRPGSFTRWVWLQKAPWEISSQRGPWKITLTKSFYLGKYEVTQEQWKKIMGSNPSRFKGARNPVDSVSWDDCTNFVAKLKEKVPGQAFRLPTEAEWEYACRAGTTTKYSFGDSETSLGEYAWYESNSGLTTHPVGEKKPNAWGLYDMYGNVWEWCADWSCRYTDGDQTDPIDAPTPGKTNSRYNHNRRVIRGGSSRSFSTATSASRGWSSPDTLCDTFGLRLAATAEKEK